MPNQEIIKVYKKHITNEERMLSAGRIISYPDEVQREISLKFDGNELIFAVYICYDFIIENKNKRADLIFVPQYEAKPQKFINEGDRISKGKKCFVLGSNNSDHKQKSLGFAILNSSVVSSLALQNLRPVNYQDNHGETLDQHHSTIYDIVDEKLLILDLNVGKPYSLSFTYSLDDSEPVLIPISLINIQPQ